MGEGTQRAEEKRLPHDLREHRIIRRCSRYRIITVKTNILFIFLASQLFSWEINKENKFSKFKLLHYNIKNKNKIKRHDKIIYLKLTCHYVLNLWCWIFKIFKINKYDKYECFANLLCLNILSLGELWVSFIMLLIGKHTFVANKQLWDKNSNATSSFPRFRL